MKLYDLFTTDKNLETDGIYVEIGEAKFLIARAGGSNKKFAKIARKRLAPFNEAVRRGAVDEETSLKVLVEIYADSVILGWENVTDDKDKTLEFNRKNVIKLLTDLPDLFEYIREEAEKVSNFRPLEENEHLETLGNG